MEIGFSSFGSTVSLPGALRASEKDAFVTQMRLTIIRESDRAQHNFSWRAFKSSSISMDTLAPENIEIATSFIVPTNVPRPMHVFFASENFTQQYAQDADELRSSWLLFGQRKLHEVGDPLKAQIQDPAFVDTLFQEFARGSVPVDFYTRLNHGFFWHAGNYCIVLEVTCADVPQRVYRWSTSLSEKEEQRLRFNTVAIMKELCSIKVQYDFVYKPYHAAT